MSLPETRHHREIHSVFFQLELGSVKCLESNASQRIIICIRNAWVPVKNTIPQHLSSGISAASIKWYFCSIYQVVFLQCKNQCSEGWTHPLRGRSVWTKRVRTDCPSHCLSNMVLGGKKGWVHENLRPFSLVLWFYLCLLFLLPTTSSVPEHPQDLKKYRMQDHGSSEPSRSKSPPRPTPSLLLDMRFQQRH